MKIPLSTILLFLISTYVFSQQSSIDANTIDTLCIKALNNRFDVMLRSGYTYLKPTAQSKRLKNANVSNRYKFLSLDELRKISLKEKKTIYLTRITHKIISKDTIDINLSTVGYKVKRKLFRNINEFSLSCGGTKGYQPSMRFVYDKVKKDWILIHNSSVVADD